MRTLLIDGDLLAYQTASGHEEQIDWGDGVWTTTTNVPFACEAMDEKLDVLSHKLDADAIVICLSDTENFRNAIFPDYKISRRDKRRPTGLRQMREYLAEKYKTYQRPSLEADDVMGILATHPALIEGEKIIVSEDKDMKTIPALIFNPAKDDEPRRISEGEADHWHMFQTLTGDPADDYPGCPGIGPTRAGKLLDGDGPMWPKVVAAFEKKGLTEDDALVQARVARILRASDYNFRFKEVVLWCPS